MTDWNGTGLIFLRMTHCGGEGQKRKRDEGGIADEVLNFDGQHKPKYQE